MLLPAQERLQASEGLGARAMSPVSLLRPALSICFLVPPQNQQCNGGGKITEGHRPTFRWTRIITEQYLQATVSFKISTTYYWQVFPHDVREHELERRRV